MSADIELPNGVTATYFRNIWICTDEDTKVLMESFGKQFVAPATGCVDEVEEAMARYVAAQIEGARFLGVFEDDEFDDPGPCPDMVLEDTPENRAELEKMRKEAEDPTTPAGRFYKSLSETRGVDD